MIGAARRGLLWMLGGGLTSWLAYVVLASSIAASELGAAASRMGLTLEHVEARSWFPGRLVLHDLVVSHPLLEGECRTTVGRVELPHSVVGLVVGDLRISTLTADDSRIACEFGAQATIPVARAASPAMFSRMGGSILANGAGAAASAVDSVEIEHAVVRVAGVAMGDAALADPFELTAAGLHLDRDAVRLQHAEATLRATAITYAGQTVLDNLSVSFRASTAPGPAESGADSELQATLEIREADVRGLPGEATELLTGVKGTLRAALTWRDTRLASGSSLRLSLGPFSWTHEGGAVTRFEKTWVVSAEALSPSDGRPASVEWRASIPALRYQSERALTTAAVQDVSASVRYETGAMLPLEQPGSVSLRTGNVVVNREHQSLAAERMSLSGKLSGSTGSPEAKLFDSATLTLSGARLLSEPQADNKATARNRFSAEVLVKAAPATRGYSGTMRLRGGDAGVILLLMRNGELPGWITSKFHGEPFSLEAALHVQNGIVQISELELERGALSLRGWWRLEQERRDGALLMEYGGLRIGIAGGPEARVIMRPNEEWLQSRRPPSVSTE